MTRKHLGSAWAIFLFCCGPIFALGQAPSKHTLSLLAGGHQVKLLDLHASPIIHKGPGPGFQVRYVHEGEKRSWDFDLGYGKLRFQPSQEALRFRKPSFSGDFVQLQATNLYTLSDTERWTWQVGGMIRQMLMMDFDGVGNFPWIFAAGGMYAKGKVHYRLNETHAFSGTLALPLASWITDMPYEHIPRIEGQAPGVNSALREGTRLTSWNSFQQVLAELDYHYSLSDNWSFQAQYQWNWMHEAQPSDLWAYRHGLLLGFNYHW
ncbi:MAG: hypothetical protein AAFV07_12350 [Bacteroidota bacterium]